MSDLFSKRLRFINSTGDIIDKILDGNEALSAYLGINVPDKWSDFGTEPFQYVKRHLEEDPSYTPWGHWLAILTDENMLVGNCGYKGPPKDGQVEIGYEVNATHRGIGLATEIAAVLIENAFEYPEVKKVIAHTLAEENASCKVLRKCGFQFVGEVMDPEDGMIWRWELDRGRFG